MVPKYRAPTPPGEILLSRSVEVLRSFARSSAFERPPEFYERLASECLEEFLKPLGMSRVQAAQQMGIPLNRLNEVIRSKRGITADTALRLARLLHNSPEFWMNLQTASDLYWAALALERSEV